MKFTGGLPETACGAGSTLKTTERLREAFPDLLRTCGIRTLVDAPCGDGNWISQTDLTGVEYIGVDLNRENLAMAIGRQPRAGYEPKTQSFTRGDIEKVVFGPADAILCRDFFQHLPTAAVLGILAKLNHEDVKWLLATSFNNEANDEIGPEMFRPINLQIAPFNLGAPQRAIDDPPGSGRILGAWRL